MARLSKLAQGWDEAISNPMPAIPSRSQCWSSEEPAPTPGNWIETHVSPAKDHAWGESGSVRCTYAVRDWRENATLGALSFSFSYNAPTGTI
ncbi:unnamed protein product [Periconia digitata]|uniref:Uncharacterized protein n=1 Tax=Periconia digitata TaxID=1303443 RepID=A0A9W4XQL7_9PLEO|nr:unnamed protein product [Periconia digitata]